VSIEQPPSEARAGSPTPASSGAEFVGVDVGGTKVSIALMRAGKLEQPHELPTDCSGQDALIDQLHRGILEAIQRCRGRPAAVGVGIPSVIEFARGRVRSSVNVPLHDVALGELLSERLGGIEVYIDNDATCAALAEAHDQDGRLDCKHLVMLTVGTGVGGGIIIDGRPFRGATGAAGELGHMIIGMDLSERAAPQGGFPKPGSLEALAAGRALDQLTRSAAAAHPDSALAALGADGHELAGPDAVSSARDGDPEAIAVLELLGHRLGVGIANAINIFDPEVVAIGGGVSAASELLLDHARESAWSFVLPGVGTGTEIRLARSGPQAGVRGAALLASQEFSHARPAVTPQSTTIPA
jgi:glucokinase